MARNIIIDPATTNKIIRVNYEQLYTYKFDNLGKNEPIAQKSQSAKTQPI